MFVYIVCIHVCPSLLLDQANIIDLLMYVEDQANKLCSIQLNSDYRYCQYGGHLQNVHLINQAGNQ